MKNKPQSTNPAILFDLDGTLIDTVYEHVLAWSEALTKARISVSHWEIHRRIGMSGSSLVQQLAREQTSKRRPLLVQQLERWHDLAFTKATRDVRLLPGTTDLLRHLSQNGLPWAIATTGGRKQTSRLLKKVNLSAKIIVTGDEVEKAKPSPDVFVLAAHRLEVPIDRCIVVGDSVWDMLAAGRSKALAVGILAGGYGKEELERSGAFRVYADPSEILSHIEDLGIG